MVHELALALGLSAVTVSGCGGGGSGSTSTAMATGPAVFEPTTAPYGKSYSDWSAAWWQWALHIPKADNPMLDETGEKQSADQSGPVWFLAGTGGGSVERSCIVPAGKAVLVPVINNAGVITETWETVEGMTAVVKDAIDYVTEIQLSVDGVAMNDLSSYRFASPPFTVTFDAQDPVWPVAPGPFTAVSDGYWVMLQPLSVGQHTLFLRAKAVVPASTPSGTEVFETQVTYHLTVQ